MARGHQKVQSQQKNAAKKASMKKGNSAAEQKKAALKALVFQCTVCKSQMPDAKTYRQHFESKHPKAPMPEELQGVDP